VNDVLGKILGYDAKQIAELRNEGIV